MLSKVLIIVILAALLFLGILYGIYYIVFRTIPLKKRPDITFSIPSSEQYQEKRDEMVELVKNLNEIPYEKVEMISRDGLKLAARYYEPEGGAEPEKTGIAILFHGYKSSAVRDFAGGAKELRNMGIPVILVDERAQGSSQGRAVTFGAKEQYDVLDWIAWAGERFGEKVPIGLYGISMGASSVLLAAGQKLPSNVRLAVADCPFSSAREVIGSVIKGMHLPAGFFYPQVALSARIFAHCNLKNTDAASAVKKSCIPILIIHGEEDRFVPVEESRRIAQASPDQVTLETFPGAGHGISYIQDKERYVQLLHRMVKQFMPAQEA